MNAPIYDISVKTIDGKKRALAAYKGRPMLIVNTASECGLTPQYKGLEELHEAYGKRGLAVLGFPCNQFGAQEPGTEAEIATFCEKNFGVTFPLFAKIDVNGERTHPLFEYLKKAKPGLLGSETIRPPRVPVISNVSINPESDPATIKRLLIEQITGRVRWRETIEGLRGRGISSVVEVGAGKVLSTMAKRIDKELPTTSIETPQEIEAFIKTL